MSRFFSLFVILSCALPGAAEVGPQHYYRLAADTNTTLTTFHSHGILEWSNAASGGDFLIERCESLVDPQWEPFARGAVSNSVSSFKVEEFHPPAGMNFVPGGRFTMGDTFGENSIASPTRTVWLDPFLMKQHEVTNEELRSVLQWAYDQGMVGITNDVVYAAGTTNGLLTLAANGHELDFANGSFSVLAGKESHPCVHVSWYGAAAYCNYLSLMEGKDPCYDLTDWSCDFTLNGHRLPTEAEWECAARGGYEGMRFAWGDTNVITHSRANYRSSTNYTFDVSPTLGFHPDYADQLLRTSPVGAFPPNGYGLYDVCGNVWEWCWDWAARYPSDTEWNPTGPAGGVRKVFRGGSNFTTAERVTCAARYVSTKPAKFGYDTGFRTAMTLVE